MQALRQKRLNQPGLHLKIGFDEATKKRKELPEWLENGYFD